MLTAIKLTPGYWQLQKPPPPLWKSALHVKYNQYILFWGSSTMQEIFQGIFQTVLSTAKWKNEKMKNLKCPWKAARIPEGQMQSMEGKRGERKWWEWSGLGINLWLVFQNIDLVIKLWTGAEMSVNGFEYCLLQGLPVLFYILYDCFCFWERQKSLFRTVQEHFGKFSTAEHRLQKNTADIKACSPPPVLLHGEVMINRLCVP